MIQKISEKKMKFNSSTKVKLVTVNPAEKNSSTIQNSVGRISDLVQWAKCLSLCPK